MKDQGEIIEGSERMIRRILEKGRRIEYELNRRNKEREERDQLPI